MRVVPTVTASLLLLAAAPPDARMPDSLDAFALSWSGIEGYSATLTMHETAGSRVEDRAYAYTFKKPAEATIQIVSGPGRGGKVVWTGGDDVVGSPPGLLSGMKLRLPLDNARVTSLRGDTIVMASFGWVLDHFRGTAGSRIERPGPLVDGTPTTEVSLSVEDPDANDGLTREVLELSTVTKLPVDVRRYAGTDLVKEIHYTNVVVESGTPAPSK